MSNIRTILAIVGIFSFLFGGCGKQSARSSQTAEQVQLAKPLTGPPEVTSEEGEGFHDLIFYIQEYKQLPDGSKSIRSSGIYKGRQLGFEVILGPSWKSGSLGKDIPLVINSGALVYRSIGAESDAFIQVLDELYDTKITPKTMAEEAHFTGISLEGDPKDLSKGPVKIKTFFEGGNEADYAEFFTDIDLAAHRIGVHEKDEGYRSAVIKAFQAH